MKKIIFLAIILFVTSILSAQLYVKASDTIGMVVIPDSVINKKLEEVTQSYGAKSLLALNGRAYKGEKVLLANYHKTNFHGRFSISNKDIYRYLIYDEKTKKNKIINTEMNQKTFIPMGRIILLFIYFGILGIERCPSCEESIFLWSE